MKIKNIITKYAIYLVLVVLVAFFSIVSPVFLTKDNLFNILRQVAVVGIAAVGMTFVIITSGIDLSVGSIIGISGLLTAMMMVGGVHPVFAVIISLVAGLVIGLINGFIINQFSIPPLIATLGTLSIWRGVTYLLTGGLPVYGFTKGFAFIGQGYIWIFPVPVIIMILIFVGGYLILNKFTIGRYIYSIGGNEEAARLSGINVKNIRYFVYAASGLLCSLAGVVLLSRTNSGQPKAGTGYELDIITGVVLGGVSITGGEGKFIGVVAGILIMGILSNGMIITNVGDYVQRIVQGVVLIVAVGFDAYNQKQKKIRISELEAIKDEGTN